MTCCAKVDDCVHGCCRFAAPDTAAFFPEGCCLISWCLASAPEIVPEKECVVALLALPLSALCVLSWMQRGISYSSIQS
jgi:hypothetical protein